MGIFGIEERILPMVEYAGRSLLTLTEAEALVTETESALADKSASFDTIWILIAGFLVFFMQAGFALLEAGTVRSKNAINILFKNVMDVSLAGFIYFAVGYSLAYGSDEMGTDRTIYRFIGRGSWFLTPVSDDTEVRSDHVTWFFQFAFAATAATIVSGAVAERTKLNAYFVYSILITGFVYPVVSHWIWATGGWLSAFQDADAGYHPFWSTIDINSCGMLDYAGSGVVHMTGGFAGLVGAYVVGPRTGRFVKEADGSNGEPVDLPGHNVVLSVLGTMILWFGWYGFNCGSTLALDGPVASKVAVTTTLSPAAACIVGSIINYNYLSKKWDLGVALNCVLAGLVSITAGCSVVEDWHAIIIGGFGACVYLASSYFLLHKLKIDDPLDAWAVHGACGVWGCLAVGIFGSKYAISVAYSCPLPAAGNSSGTQILIQLIGVCAIMLWVCGLSFLIFFSIDKTIGMRIDEATELKGLDSSEHGGNAYDFTMPSQTSKLIPKESV